MNGNSQHDDTDTVASVEATETQLEHPPALPDGWEASGGVAEGWGRPFGFGYRDGWGAATWDTTPSSDTSHEGHISESKTLRNIRVDFNNAGLSFEGKQGRDIALDDLESKLWASIQSYRSSEEARKGLGPYPTFTGHQVLQRLENTTAQLTSHIQQHDALVKQVIEASSTLSALRARERQASKEIETLQKTHRELEGLKEIVYARLV
ncbi:hypothetical protein F5880DRAFT_1608637 [Lentinula raphanica]|nr:hypothetical protein F5880DRAFT_1608637 [Lentinula raphanica]